MLVHVIVRTTMCHHCNSVQSQETEVVAVHRREKKAKKYVKLANATCPPWEEFSYISFNMHS